MWSLFLFADTREDPLRSPEVIWGVAGLTISLLVGAAVIYAVDQWRKRAAAGSTDADATNSLTTYRTMYENGEITEEEYTKLRNKVADKVKQQPVAPKPDAPAAPAGTMPPLPSMPPRQSGERQTVNPPPSPNAAPEPPPPPGTA
jgi:hypothetical protein